MPNHSALKLRLFHLFDQTVTDTFHLTAHSWQCAIGANILEASELKKPMRLLCVRPTGGGKSLVFNVLASLLKGVTLCICPLLSLGADQTKKTLAIVNRPSPPRVIIYMSPQSLSSKKGKTLIPFLIRHGLIRLVVIDEIHLVPSFGNTFRNEFNDLPQSLFQHIKCLMLFLTATCT